MFLITNGSSVVALAANDKQVREYLVVRKAAAEKQALGYVSSSSYYKNMYPTVESFVAANLRGLHVLEIDFTGRLEVNDYQAIRGGR